MSRDSILEIQHKREQSHDSGTYQDWTLEESFQHNPAQQSKNSDFVTVVAVVAVDEKPFVTVLSVENDTSDSEDVLVYRLPGERLGFGLKFDGGIKNAEKVKKLLIQSCADDSPASRTRASWGPLAPGDEILVIDSVPVSEMTRMDCVRALKESNVVIKLGVRKGHSKEEDKEAPPIPPRKFPRKKENVELPSYSPHQPVEEHQKNSPPVQPRSRQLPQAELYTDLISQECILPTESESDDTGSSISTVVSRISSTPTTCNSSFSDGRSIDMAPPSVLAAKPTAYDLDKVLEPFLRLEREFSSTAINETNLFHSLAEASNLKSPSPLEEEEEVPKAAPRQDARRPPPPPPPRAGRHLPRLIDFVPKDRTDLVVPSPLPTPQLPSQPKLGEEPIKDEMPRSDTKELPDGIEETKSSNMEPEEFMQKPESLFHQEKYPPSCSRLPPDGHEYPSQNKILAKPTNELKVSVISSTPPTDRKSVV